MIDTIIFDLDGTLLDTLGDLTDSVNYVMRLHSFPEHTPAQIRSFVGNGIPTLIKRSVPLGTDEKTTEICITEMRKYYKEHAQIKTKPYDGVSELLNILKDKRIKTAVVTNKAQDAAKILCDNIFGNVFTAVIGDDGKNKLKPAPDNVFRAMKIVGSDGKNTLYVGDSDVDMQTAHRASLPAVGVLWGFRDRAALENSGAEYIISNPSELIGLL